MKRPLIIWVIFNIILTLCLLCSGCRTGGKWIKSGSAGKIISPENIQKGSDGIYRPKKAPSNGTVKPQESPQVINEPQSTTNQIVSEKVKIESVRSKPDLPKNSNIEPQHVPQDVKPAGTQLKPFTPTTTSTIPFNNPPKTKGQIEKPITHVNIDKEDVMKINWLELFCFYFLCAALLFFIWMVYDLAKDVVRHWKYRNPETPKPKITRI